VPSIWSFFVALSLDLVGDVLLADHQLLLVAAANEAGPNHLGLHAALQGFGADTLDLERLGELLRRDAHALRHAFVGLVDVGDAGIDPVLLPSFIFTLSSISSLMTSCRAGVFWVVSWSSLERCSMS